MSTFASSSIGLDWSHNHGSLLPSHAFSPRLQYGNSSPPSYGHVRNLMADGLPSLRTSNSFPSFSRSEYCPRPMNPPPHCQDDVTNILRDYAPSFSNHCENDAASDQANYEAVYRVSPPASPVMDLASIPKDARSDVQSIEDEDDSNTTSEEYDSRVDNRIPKTVAELRAEKRKMKRFRLTHNQTRFLMSEFARQAHPDAAQRERLSREIPGLSSRQVQVWFQNRRAKLKRLTSDDRERMMSSRALPENFTASQALQSPFVPRLFAGGPYAIPAAPPTPYTSSFGDGVNLRPVKMEDTTPSAQSGAHILPLLMTSSYRNFYTPPGSLAASGTVSPISPSSDRASLLGNPVSQDTSSSFSSPFARSNSFSTSRHIQSNSSAFQLSERMQRPRAESLASPLRSSMSFGPASSNNTTPYTTFHASPSQTITVDGQSRSYQSDVAATFQYPGFSCDNSQSFQSSMLARPRLPVTTLPPGLDVRSQYRSFAPYSYPTPHTPQTPHDFESASGGAATEIIQDFGSHQNHQQQLESCHPLSPRSTYSSTYGITRPYHEAERSQEHEANVEGLPMA